MGVGWWTVTAVEWWAGMRVVDFDLCGSVVDRYRGGTVVDWYRGGRVMD